VKETVVAEFVPVEPFDIIIFGVTGDLSRQKLLPALFHRYCDGQIDDSCRIIGVARGTMENTAFLDMVHSSCALGVADEFPEAKWRRFSKLLCYFDIDATDADADWKAVKKELATDGRPRIFYLAVAPRLYVPICEALRDAGLRNDAARVVLEKPIGSDLQSADEINKGVGAVFEESNIFRMDHYLGKETVQNLLILRFANMLFEPLWSNRSIDHIQITVAESLGVEGRDAYYDSAGAVRDIVQNHLLQLLCLIAMEPPNSLDAENVRGEKIKVLRALKGFEAENIGEQTVRAQYNAGHVDENRVPGYLDALPDNLKNSRTETYAAIKTEIANWRWAGVPFYLRTGKRMAERRSEIVIQFKSTPHNLFGEGGNQPNRLVLRLQPDEGMQLYMQVKEPGPGHMSLRSIPLDLSYARSFSAVKYPDAYERLLMDVVRGNLALFMGQEEVRAAWAWTDDLLSAWDQAGQKLEYYAAGTDGPLQASLLLDRDGRAWWDGTSAE
jgi:glucose-6-phosphate 1-dehydrogenase